MRLKSVTSWRGRLRVIAPEQHSFLRRNIIVMVSRWQHCVRSESARELYFRLPVLKTNAFPPTNRPVAKELQDLNNFAITMQKVFFREMVSGTDFCSQGVVIERLDSFFDYLKQFPSQFSSA